MTLYDALEDTGLAISKNDQVIMSVERLPRNMCLIMSRRGVSILEYRRTPLDSVYTDPHLQGRDWVPATIRFVTFT
jgi:hypothetical protein